MAFPLKPPPWCPGIRTGHPLAQGLIFCPPLWEGSGYLRDPVTGLFLDDIVGTTWMPGPCGIGLDFNSGANEFAESHSPPSRWTSVPCGSVFALCQPETVHGGTVFFYGDATVNDRWMRLSVTAGNDIHADVRDTGYEFYRNSADAAYAAGDVLCFGVVQDGVGGDAPKMYLNGREIATANDGSAENDLDGWWAQFFVAAPIVALGMARDFTPGGTFNGVIYGTWGWDRALAASEIAELYADPWGLITPRRFF